MASGSWLYTLATYLIFPGLMGGSLALGLLGLSVGAPALVILVGTLVCCLGVELVLERVLPFRRAWSERRRLADDLICMGLNAVTQRLVDAFVLGAVLLAAMWLHGVVGATLWPTRWPLALQVVVAVLIADLGHYVAHRMLHRVPWMWAFHRLHHSPDSLDATNFYRMHPFDIVVKAAFNSAPLVLLGAPEQVMVLWMILSGVSAGSVNHANIDVRTGWLDAFLSTPHLHRSHHARDLDGPNLGNITVLYDRLFGTYLCPPGTTVGEVGVAGGARPVLVELSEPFRRRAPAPRGGS